MTMMRKLILDQGTIKDGGPIMTETECVCYVNGECICYALGDCDCEIECECDDCEDMKIEGCPCGGNCMCGAS